MDYLIVKPGMRIRAIRDHIDGEASCYQRGDEFDVGGTEEAPTFRCKLCDGRELHHIYSTFDFEEVKGEQA